MKRQLLVCASFLLAVFTAIAATWIDPETRIVWYYTVSGGEAELGPWTAVPISTQGAITIPSSLGGCPMTYVGDYAFNGCSGLTSVTIPSSVTSIRESAFNGCSGLTEFIVDDNNPNYCSVNRLLLTKDGKTLVHGVDGEVTIPSSVTHIGGFAFSGCSGLTSVTIPASVTSLGDWAFYGCSGLKTFIVDDNNPNYRSINRLLLSKDGKTLIRGVTGPVTIPPSVTNIGDWAFDGCSGLTSVTIPASVTSIGDGAFEDCCGLTSVTIPSSVTSIGAGAFEDCSALTSVTIPASVTNISDYAFYECIGLTSVAIPPGVTSIGGWAFYGCCGLRRVTIPSSVTSIGAGAFMDCSGLMSVTIPSSVTSIGDGAFAGCSGLTSVTIPSSVTSIGGDAFNLCDALETVYVEKGDADRVWVLCDWPSGVQIVEGMPLPESGFDGSVKHTFNGLVYGSDGTMCGIAQITTAKATKAGVKVSGFVMLSDGKKQTIKAATGTVNGGYLTVSTSCGKIGTMELTVGSVSFKGTLGDQTLVTETLDEDTGILSGTLKLSYFDTKTGKIKTKSVTVGGAISDGKAIGTASVKGQGAKAFEAEME